MISDYCPITQFYFGYQKKQCQLCHKHQFSLIDRKNEKFDLMMDDKCRMHLLNCRTLFIEPTLANRVQGFFLHFTNENKETTNLVLAEIFENQTHQKTSRIKSQMKTTYGYFKAS